MKTESSIHARTSAEQLYNFFSVTEKETNDVSCFPEDNRLLSQLLTLLAVKAEMVISLTC
jgi:hypothetical protein